jgi:hypothetical protein
MPVKMAMMAITTRSSIRVKPFLKQVPGEAGWTDRMDAMAIS